MRPFSPRVRNGTKPVPAGGSRGPLGGGQSSGEGYLRAQFAAPGREGLKAPAALQRRPLRESRGGGPLQRRDDNTRVVWCRVVWCRLCAARRRPPSPPGAAARGTHLMTVPLAPPAVVSMTRVVRLPRRSSWSRPSSAAQHSSAGWLRGRSVQPPGWERGQTGARPQPGSTGLRAGCHGHALSLSGLKSVPPNAAAAAGIVRRGSRKNTEPVVTVLPRRLEVTSTLKELKFVPGNCFTYYMQRVSSQKHDTLPTHPLPQKKNNPTTKKKPNHPPNPTTTNKRAPPKKYR